MKARISINGKRHEKYFNTSEDADKWLAFIIEKYSDKSIDNEIWKDIIGFNNYQASNLGRLRSKNYKNSGLIKVLTPSISKDGYLKTMLLSDQKKYKSWTVHKFITLAFYGPIPEGKEINHIDGNKLNNEISNLEYCTRSENMKHAIVLGLQKPKIGQLNGMSKLTNEQVHMIRKSKKENGRFWGRNKIAKELNISAKHLQRIANEKNNSWTNI